MKLVGRNIANDVFAETKICPPHIPLNPPLSVKDKWETKVSLAAGFWDCA
jgi:hypothetical protein